MSDLVIREQDGWHEITELLSKDGFFEIWDELWKAVGRGDWAQADSLIWDALDEDHEEDYRRMIGRGTPKVFLTATPDDILGEYVRIWVKV